MRECTCGYGSPEGRETCIKCGKRFDAMEAAASRDELRNTIASLRAELETAKKAHEELLGRYLRVQDELVVSKGCSKHGTNWDPECLECDSKCPESERGKQ